VITVFLCHPVLRCNWYRNLAAVNCILHWIVLILSTLQMGIHRRSQGDLWGNAPQIFRTYIYFVLCETKSQTK